MKPSLVRIGRVDVEDLLGTENGEALPSTDETSSAGGHGAVSRTADELWWLREAVIAVANDGARLLVGCDDLFLCLAPALSESDTANTAMNSVPVYRVAGGGSSSELGLISQAEVVNVAPSIYALLIGYDDGMLRIFNGNCQVLVEQAILDGPISQIRLQTPADALAEVIVLSGDVVAIINADTIRQAVLQAHRFEQPMNLSYTRWQLDNHDTIVDVCGRTGGPPSMFDELVYRGGGLRSYSSSIVAVGATPTIAIYGTDRKKDSHTPVDLAKTIARSFKNAVSGWFSAAPNEPVDHLPATLPPNRVAAAIRVADERRQINGIWPSPCGLLAALCDNLGRVLLIELKSLCIARVWKGYRDAQCSWITSSSTSSDIPAKRTGRPQLVDFLCIYAPKRGLLEVWQPHTKARVWAREVGYPCRLLAPDCSLLAANGGYVLRNSYLITSDCSINRIVVPFDCANRSTGLPLTSDHALLSNFKQLLSLGSASTDQNELVEITNVIEKMQSVTSLKKAALACVEFFSTLNKDIMMKVIHELQAAALVLEPSGETADKAAIYAVKLLVISYFSFVALTPATEPMYTASTLDASCFLQFGFTGEGSQHLVNLLNNAQTVTGKQTSVTTTTKLSLPEFVDCFALQTPFHLAINVCDTQADILSHFLFSSCQLALCPVEYLISALQQLDLAPLTLARLFCRYIFHQPVHSLAHQFSNLLILLGSKLQDEHVSILSAMLLQPDASRTIWHECLQTDNLGAGLTLALIMRHCDKKCTAKDWHLLVDQFRALLSLYDLHPDSPFGLTIDSVMKHPAKICESLARHVRVHQISPSEIGGDAEGSFPPRSILSLWPVHASPSIVCGAVAHQLIESFAAQRSENAQALANSVPYLQRCVQLGSPTLAVRLAARFWSLHLQNLIGHTLRVTQKARGIPKDRLCARELGLSTDCVGQILTAASALSTLICTPVNNIPDVVFVMDDTLQFPFISGDKPVLWSAQFGKAHEDLIGKALADVEALNGIIPMYTAVAMRWQQLMTVALQLIYTAGLVNVDLQRMCPSDLNEVFSSSIDAAVILAPGRLSADQKEEWIDFLSQAVSVAVYHGDVFHNAPTVVTLAGANLLEASFWCAKEFQLSLDPLRISFVVSAYARGREHEADEILVDVTNREQTGRLLLVVAGRHLRQVLKADEKEYLRRSSKLPTSIHDWALSMGEIDETPQESDRDWQTAGCESCPLQVSYSSVALVRRLSVKAASLLPNDAFAQSLARTMADFQ